MKKLTFIFYHQDKNTICLLTGKRFAIKAYVYVEALEALVTATGEFFKVDPRKFLRENGYEFIGRL